MEADPFFSALVARHALREGAGRGAGLLCDAGRRFRGWVGGRVGDASPLVLEDANRVAEVRIARGRRRRRCLQVAAAGRGPVFVLYRTCDHTTRARERQPVSGGLWRSAHGARRLSAKARARIKGGSQGHYSTHYRRPGHP